MAPRLSAIVLSLTIALLTGCDSEKVQQPQATNVPERKQMLDGGIVGARTLDEIDIEVIRLAAAQNGQAVNRLPEWGSVSLWAIDVNRIDPETVEQVLPLLCEGSYGVDPDYWTSFSEIWITAFQGYTYAVITDLVMACSANRAVARGGYWNSAGAWHTEAASKLAVFDRNIAYGTYLPNKTD